MTASFIVHNMYFFESQLLFEDHFKNDPNKLKILIAPRRMGKSKLLSEIKGTYINKYPTGNPSALSIEYLRGRSFDHPVMIDESVLIYTVKEKWSLLQSIQQHCSNLVFAVSPNSTYLEEIININSASIYRMYRPYSEYLNKRVGPGLLTVEEHFGLYPEEKKRGLPIFGQFIYKIR